MNLTDMNQVLSRCGLPVLGPSQLAAIDAAGQRQAFERTLQNVDASALDPDAYIGLVLRGTAEWLPDFLTGLGFRYEPRQFVDLALQERMQLFRAIHAVRTNHADRATALQYLKGLTLTKAQMPAAETTTIAPYYSFPIYGTNAALCVSEAKTRSTSEATVQIEGAGALGNGTRNFDWPNKIVVQLTPQECMLLLAVLRNRLPSAEFKAHGRQHDKVLGIENQGNRYFVKLLQKGRAAVAVSVQPVDAVRIIALLTRQIRTNMPTVDVPQLDMLIADMAAMMKG
jgi:hypothetical protein